MDERRQTRAVFELGDKLNVFARTSDDAHLLVYEIDAEGYVHMLFPFGHGPSDVAAKQMYSLPPDSSDYDLVVQGPIGEGYVVAVASLDEFAHMPWFLRPYDPQAADLGYQHSGEDADVEGRDGGGAHRRRSVRRDGAHPPRRARDAG